MFNGIRRFFSDNLSYIHIRVIYARNFSGDLSFADKTTYNNARAIIKTNILIYDVNGNIRRKSRLENQLHTEWVVS